jgi:hypothetical membrane protein
MVDDYVPASKIRGMLSATWKKRVFYLMFIDLSIYLALLFAAMAVYPGGSHYNPSTDGYSFFTNYISDLGRIKSWSGEPNDMSRVLFTIACLVDGTFFSWFIITFASMFLGSKKGKRWGITGCITSIIATIFVSSLPFVPIDTEPTEHDLLAGIIFEISLLGTVFISYAVFERKDYPRFYGRVLLAAIFVEFTYLFFVIILEKSAVIEPVILVVLQKIAVFGKITCWYIQTIGALRHLNLEDVQRHVLSRRE